MFIKKQIKKGKPLCVKHKSIFLSEGSKIKEYIVCDSGYMRFKTSHNYGDKKHISNIQVGEYLDIMILVIWKWLLNVHFESL
jgi:hypothetical protein